MTYNGKYMCEVNGDKERMIFIFQCPLLVLCVQVVGTATFICDYVCITIYAWLSFHLHLDSTTPEPSNIRNNM